MSCYRAVIGGFRSDLSITRNTDGNFGNVPVDVLISIVISFLIHMDSYRWQCCVCKREATGAHKCTSCLKLCTQFVENYQKARKRVMALLWYAKIAKRLNKVSIWHWFLIPCIKNGLRSNCLFMLWNISVIIFCVYYNHN